MSLGGVYKCIDERGRHAFVATLYMKYTTFSTQKGTGPPKFIYPIEVHGVLFLVAVNIGYVYFIFGANVRDEVGPRVEGA